jgi:hypothetical protein
LKRARENAGRKEGESGGYARSLAPTPAWHENGGNVRKLIESAKREHRVLSIADMQTFV